VRTTQAFAPKPDLVSVLLGGYHRQLLALLLLHPDQSFYVRELSRLTGVPAGPAHRELGRFAEVGLLSRTTLGNQVRYQASRDCPIFEELAGIFRKTVGMADVLREALQPLSKDIDAAFIFGSVAQGKEGPSSDVDVMVIGSATLQRVVVATQGARERLRREVNPVVMTARSFRTKRANHDRFVSRIMTEPKIMLMGDVDEPGESAQNRATKTAPA